MKVLFFILFVSLLSVDAQRRSARTELTENDPTPKSARRGRARFVAPPAEQQLDEQKHQEPSVRRAVLRRRPDVQAEANPRRNYEVEEIIDDTPVETFRKSAKPRVFTETKFEAQNASPVSPLFHPATTENLEEVIKSIGSLVGDTTTSSVSVSPPSSVSYEPSSSELSSSEFSKIENEITRIQPEVTTPSTTRTTRRTNGRSRNNGVVNSPSSPTVASRVRTRVRARKPEEPVSTAAPARTVHRGSRRRSETTESRTKGPSVIVAAETVEIPTRARAGRRTVGISSRKVEEVKSPEKITLDLSQPRRSSNRKPVESSTARSRTRTRFRDVPPVIDEQKLEVLPLFERETKTVKPIRKVVARRRTLNSAEEVETSATENDVKLADKPSTERRPKQNVVETKTESRPKQTVNVHSRTDSQPKQSVVVETRTESSSLKRRRQTSKPVIKESVVSEITEVTSKRTIIRRASPKPKTVETKPVARNESRGTKKSEINLGQVAGKNKSGLTSSEEEIDDTDNYPEHFKALLQAKKQKKESRSQHRLVTPPTVTKTTEKVVTSSSSTTTQIISSEANRQREDSENELDPSTPSSSRPTRRRLPQSTTEKVTRTTRKNKIVRSTTAAPLPVRDHRFHAKFNTEPEATSNSVKSNRNLSTKPPRGLYSSRKVKESHSKSKSSTGQIPTPKKSNRYSSRYRNDASSRNAIRTSTNAPYYLPTIPTITPPTTSVKSPIVSEDKDLGVEVISFDDPVNTVPSANLVSGEYLASSTESHLTSPLVSAAQTKTTEKPVSIIERIINSITAISTTEVPDPTKLTTPEQETETKESAILKLATKKPTKLDKTQSTQKLPNVTVTSEKPTTIIERIISSLSAIQADNTTDNKSFKSKQVGTNFNTISSPSTTPITRVTKSTLPAQFSTSVNPLTVLDDISSDQILLQKRTIGKLLALLNSLTSTTPCPHPPLVVVTPKAASFVTGARTASTTTTIEPVVATSIATTIAPPSTVTPTTNTANQGTTTPVTTTTPTQQPQLFTSANPNISLDSRINTPETTTIRYTNTPTVTTITTAVPETTTSATTTSTLSPSLTEAVPTSTTSNNVVNEVLPLSIDAGVTSSVTESSTSSTTDSSSSVSSTTLATTQSAVDTETAFVFPPTIPAVINFEVDQNTIPSLEANPLSIISANNATTTTANTTTEPSIRPNPLSISSISSSTTESSTSSTTTSNDSNSTTQSATTTTPGTTTSSTAPTATLPSLTEILNGRTVQAFNSIINISELNKVETLDVDRKNNPVTTMLPTTPTLSNRILEDVTTSTVRIPSTIQQSTMFTTTALPTTTTQATTTTLAPTTTTTIPPTTTTTRAPTTTTTRAPKTTTTRVPTTTRAPTTTTLIPSTTTTNIPTTVSTTTRFTATPTVVPLSQFDFTSRTTTGFPSTTFIPSFLTTLFSTTRPRRVSTTGAPITIVTPETTTTRATTPRVEIRTVSGDLSTSASTTTRYISNVVSTATAPTTLSTTTVRHTRRRSTTIPTTTIPPAVPVSTSVRSARRSTTTASTASSTKKLRQLTEQQKKDLETLAQLEMEQAAILKQLAFLTNLNFANLRTTTDKNDLANRIIALAVEQDKERQKTTTPSSETLSPEGSRQAKQITPKNDQSLDELIKQLNIATPSTITSQYGKSQDAIIAALLKEQGIGPTTPKALEDIYSQTTTASTTTTTRKPRPTTTRPPGPLMQSLNWLLNVLAPPATTTTRRPRPKSKSKSKPKPKSTTTPAPEKEDPIPTPEKKDKPNPEELLTHQPTHITPVVTPAPRKNIVSSLSQSDIQKLIKQLENLQKDPNSDDLDFSSIKSLQSLINEEGVQVSSSGTTGTTSRATTPMPRKSKSKNRVVKSTTAVPLSVSNNIADEEDATTTTRPRISLPPVRLRPVPGIEDSETLVRGQLITAAVNVTRAISTFLGTALQDAALQFTKVFQNGSGVNDYLTSSLLSRVANISTNSNRKV